MSRSNKPRSSLTESRQSLDHGERGVQSPLSLSQAADLGQRLGLPETGIEPVGKGGGAEFLTVAPKQPGRIGPLASAERDQSLVVDTVRLHTHRADTLGLRGGVVEQSARLLEPATLDGQQGEPQGDLRDR